MLPTSAAAMLVAVLVSPPAAFVFALVDSLLLLPIVGMDLYSFFFALAKGLTSLGPIVIRYRRSQNVAVTHPHCSGWRPGPQPPRSSPATARPRGPRRLAPRSAITAIRVIAAIRAPAMPISGAENDRAAEILLKRQCDFDLIDDDVLERRRAGAVCQMVRHSAAVVPDPIQRQPPPSRNHSR